MLGGRTRIYFAPVTYDGHTHLLTMSVEVNDAADFDVILPDAERLLRSVRMPVSPAGPQGSEVPTAS